ncbi:MAG: ABC transporter permease [Inquilinaceae bacterium]
MTDGSTAIDAVRYVYAVWRRQVLVWRRLIWSSLASNVGEPLLFLFAFGFGLGALVDRVGGLPYLVFVVPGMMAYSVLFASSFEATISAYARFQLQRTWNAILATPVTLTELLLGEISWATTKGVMSACSVIIVGWLWGGVPQPAGALLALPILALGGVCFACCGLAATALSKSWEFFAYFFTFWISPMFVFSGTFFEVDRFPFAIQILAWALPMTHLIAVIRPMTAGTPIDPTAALGHLAYLAILSAAAFALARHRLSRRLFD